MTSSLWSYFLSCQMRVSKYLYFPRHINALPAFGVIWGTSNIQIPGPYSLRPFCKRNKWRCLIQLQLPYKYHILGGLNSRYLCISHSSEAGKSKNVHTLLSLPLLIMATALIMKAKLGSHLHLALFIALKALSQNTVIWRVRVSTYEWWGGGTIQLITQGAQEPVILH